jgi:hypothetical protein
VLRAVVVRCFIASYSNFHCIQPQPTSFDLQGEVKNLQTETYKQAGATCNGNSQWVKDIPKSQPAVNPNCRIQPAILVINPQVATCKWYLELLCDL